MLSLLLQTSHLSLYISFPISGIPLYSALLLCLLKYAPQTFYGISKIPVWYNHTKKHSEILYTFLARFMCSCLLIFYSSKINLQHSLTTRPSDSNMEDEKTTYNIPKNEKKKHYFNKCKKTDTLGQS